MPRYRRSSGFTLIELLVVIALTLVMLTLLFGPLIQGFQLTARAQTTTQAQDSARVAMEQISRELGSAAAVRDTTRQYVDMMMYINPAGVSNEQISHAYNAYIDIIPPRAGQPGSGQTYVSDPTVDPGSNTATLVPSNKNTTGPPLYILANVELGLPIAPGTTIVRWFVGLRHPINVEYVPGAGGGAPPFPAVEQPYVNEDEQQIFSRTDPNWGATETVQNGLNNPYILFRAQVSPYALEAGTGPGTGKQAVYEANSEYFAADANNNPILDDPDFFRVVKTTDPDPTNNGVDYTAAQAAAHNNRVYYWTQAAKPIININDVNLIFQPHDSHGNVVYNTATNGWLSGTETDTDGLTPILRTSVNFEPAAVSGDSLNATATSDVSQGYGTAPSDAISPYIPTQYKGSYGQWVGGPNVVVTGTNPTSGQPVSYSTYAYSQGTGAIPAGYHNGDLIENSNGGDVFDLTTGLPLNAATQWVNMSVNGDPGLVNFAIPDLPQPAQAAVTNDTDTVGTADPNNNPANPYYYITFGPGDPAAAASPTQSLQINLEDQGINADPDLLPNTNLTAVGDPVAAPASSYIPNGRVVVNSERVYGPDETPGPASNESNLVNPPTTGPIAYQLVPYMRIPFGSTIGPNQYTINYDTGIIYLGPPSVTTSTQTTPGNINVSDQFPQRRTVLVAFSYQNDDEINFAAAPNAEIVTAETPDTVKASYQTGSRIQVSIGIRLYDASNSRPVYFSLSNGVDVDNASR
jgi:prepilin-type N-terminal cleavage/methylation domain-containing protein